MSPPPFNFTFYKLNENSFMYMVNIEEISDDLKNYIDKKLVSICYPNSGFDLATIKKALLKFLKSKNTNKGKASTITIGYIAEFFNHLFLGNNGYIQEFSFFNLEENSMKKGFDGVYSYNSEYWLMESKSSKKNEMTHDKNFSIAYNDLKGKISGKAKNNPWLNAYSHIRAINSSNKTLIKKIESLSSSYINEKYDLIKNFNIIPCSTIILEDKWSEINIKETIKKFEEVVLKKEYKELVVICLNKKSLTHFKNYLES